MTAKDFLNFKPKPDILRYGQLNFLKIQIHLGYPVNLTLHDFNFAITLPFFFFYLL